ncbi:hypothetical protein NTD84_28030 [Pseudomonas sp. 14P_8.1_Bac3]|uniref:hypothetical protein n=1 Tax=Pseudomonas sp. 14P_8.1_Bac3 TaxID=2971621 RepID=UPI0021C6104C|nr:hypothetical protein [Pseudomonas sp. 14P_8.1_Bac3]MCU1763551.1 hypothetical protein [Pseudomonas sp. 14P_8.1_Bac3]
MKTPIWLAVVCLAASLPAHAQIFTPIELKDQELANLRGRYVMPGRIISFGIVMTSTWQNANGTVIGASTSMQVQQTTIKPQFYVSTIDQTGNSSLIKQGTGSVTGGNGLNNTNGVTQVVRAAGDNNTAYNDVDINVTKASEAPAIQQQGQLLEAGSTVTGANAAGSMSVSSTGSGVQLNILANNNQGTTMQRLAQGGLMQNTTLLGGSNQVRNLTSLNVVLRDSATTTGAFSGNLDQLKGLRALGF